MMFYVSALLSVSICSDHSPSMKRDDSHTPIPYSVHFFVSFGIRNCANASICFHLINNTWSNHICRCLIMYCEVIHCHVIQFHCHILWFSLFTTRHIYVREKTVCNCWWLQTFVSYQLKNGKLVLSNVRCQQHSLSALTYSSCSHLHNAANYYMSAGLKFKSFAKEFNRYKFWMWKEGSAHDGRPFLSVRRFFRLRNGCFLKPQPLPSCSSGGQ